MGDLPATATLLDNAIATGMSLATLALEAPSATVIDLLASATAAVAVGSLDMAAHSGGYHHEPNPKEPNGECKLLGPFALLVQAALGGMALLALVFKRWRERPQRPVKVWAFDASKQVVGSVLVHIANLLMSMLSSGQFSFKIDTKTVSAIQSRMEGGGGGDETNPCSFYLLNLAIDTTIGIPILIVLLRIFTALFRMTSFGSPPESIQSGHYGSPPRAKWWAKQSVIYFLGLMGMKLCVLVIFLVLPWISKVGDWALSWTEGNEELQVFFVMLFFPVIMNATQYYIIDSFIKHQKPEEQLHSRIPGEDPENYDGVTEYEVAAGSGDAVDSDDEDVIPDAKVKTKVSARSKANHSYDPQFDGEDSPTTIVGSTSAGEGRLVGKTIDLDGEDDMPVKLLKK